jgi:hypothetical protein
MSKRAPSVFVVVAAWWAFIAIDFVIHAVFLESWWQGTAAFWLPPVELAKRLPFAYAGFAFYCTALCWLMLRIGAPRVADGLKLGATVGAVFGGVAALGIYSIVRIPASFLLVGPVSTTLCSAGACGAAAWVSSGVRKWRRMSLVLAAGLGAFVVGVVAQNVLRGSHG